MRFNFKSLIKWLNPEMAVAALEVTDSAVKFLQIDQQGAVIKQENLPLSAGIVQEGKVVDQEKFGAAIAGLKGAPVILSLSSANVYTQVFNLPYLEGEKLEEAARLNLNMISPLDVKSSYSDWQSLGTNPTGGLEILGAFINQSIVNQLVEALKKQGIVTAAVEFAALSLARALSHRPNFDLNKPFIVLSVTADGLNFLILRNGQLYFNYFISWRAVQEKSGKSGQVSWEDYQKTVVDELKRLVNFYTSRWGKIGDLLVASITPAQPLVAVLKKDLGFNIEEVANPDWLAATGAAWRGLAPRAEDKFISLTSVGTEEEFVRRKILRFTALWRNVVLAALVLVMAVYFTADLLFIRTSGRFEEQLLQVGGINREEITLLENQAKNFNELVEKAIAANKADNQWSSALRRLWLLAGNDIKLTQIRLEASNGTVSLVGTAKNERVAVTFKNNLSKDAAISNVSFPLSAITVGSDGRAGFTATFQLSP